MKTRSSGSVNKLALIVVALIAFAGVASLAIYVRNAPKIQFDELRPERRPTPQKGNTVLVPVPKVDGNENVTFEKSPSKVPKNSDPLLFAVNQFLGNMPGLNLTAERVRVDNNIAMIDFPASTVFSFGSAEEATFLNGLRSAAGQFESIESVEIYVGGQRVDELGHNQITNPLPVIRPDRWTTPTKPIEGSKGQGSN